MPGVTTTPQYLLASNQSAVYLRTQSALGVWADPTNVEEDGSGDPTGIYAVRVVGTPKFSVRGAGIIQRADVMTPWGGNQSSKTGGRGWDITLSTEFFWKLGQAVNSPLGNLTQLSALFYASPWSIGASAAVVGPPAVPPLTSLLVQPFFYAADDRSSVAFAVQPFSIVYEETGGKRFEAYDCLCVPKLSWEYGQKVMLEWTIKGKWRPVVSYEGIEPEYVAPETQAPIIGINCAVTLDPFFDNVNAVSKVTIDTGWAINDVADFREVYGFGLGFISLAASPSIEIDVADLPESSESDWGSAEANTIEGNPLILAMDVGGDAITFTLNNPQLAAFPTPGETNGYRTNTLKFQGIPSSNAAIMKWTFEGTAPV